MEKSLWIASSNPIQLTLTLRKEYLLEAKKEALSHKFFNVTFCILVDSCFILSNILKYTVLGYRIYYQFQIKYLYICDTIT